MHTFTYLIEIKSYRGKTIGFLKIITGCSFKWIVVSEKITLCCFCYLVFYSMFKKIKLFWWFISNIKNFFKWRTLYCLIIMPFYGSSKYKFCRNCFIFHWKRQFRYVLQLWSHSHLWGGGGDFPDFLDFRKIGN